MQGRVFLVGVVKLFSFSKMIGVYRNGASRYSRVAEAVFKMTQAKGRQTAPRAGERKIYTAMWFLRKVILISAYLFPQKIFDYRFIIINACNEIVVVYKNLLVEWNCFHCFKKK